MRRNGWLFLVVALVLVFAACGDDDDSSSSSGSTTTEASGGAQTVDVQVDSPDVSDTQLAFTTYFPKEVTLHPGDTVDFDSNFTGEPHTVTFGTLVDQGAAKADPNAEAEPAEWQKIPALLPDGPGDAIQASAQPCFLAAGTDPPASDACTADQQKQPDFDGTQSYYNSGFLADGDTFEVKLADDIKPGTYTYFCALHRGGMMGTVTVVADDAKAQSSDDVQSAGDKEHDDLVAKMKPTMDAIKAGTLPPFLPTASPTGVIAGGGSQDVQEAVPVIYGKDSLDVKVGDAVTWTIVGPHTVTFGGDESLRTAISKSPDGSVHVNPAAFAPAGGAGQPQGPPPAAPGPPIPIDGGTYDGSGTHSSGLVLSFPPQLYTYSLKFSKAGTYDYFCAIHPDMKGVINVT